MNAKRPLIMAGAGILVLVAVAAAWVQSRRPTVTAVNNLGSDATVQLCPGQECNSPALRLPAGKSKTIVLRDRLGDRSDALRVEIEGRLVGCVPVVRIHAPRHQRLDLSLADVRAC